MKKIQLFKNYDELFNQVERYLLDKRNDGNTELNKFSLVLQLIRNSGGGTTQDIINQLIESNSYLEVETTADRLNLIFGDTVDNVIIEKGVVVRDNTGLYTLIDTITSSPNSWVNISETSLDAFLELLIEQPSPIINVRNIGLAQDNVWIGDNLNKPVPNPVGITIIGTASLVAGTVTIEDELITSESIVTLSPTTTGTLTGNLRYTVSAGQVVVESRNASNVLINTDTVTFGFNIETGVADTIRKSKYINVVENSVRFNDTTGGITSGFVFNKSILEPISIFVNAEVSNLSQIIFDTRNNINLDGRVLITINATDIVFIYSTANLELVMEIPKPTNGFRNINFVKTTSTTVPRIEDFTVYVDNVEQTVTLQAGAISPGTVGNMQFNTGAIGDRIPVSGFTPFPYQDRLRWFSMVDYEETALEVAANNTAGQQVLRSGEQYLYGFDFNQPTGATTIPNLNPARANATVPATITFEPYI